MKFKDSCVGVESDGFFKAKVVRDRRVKRMIVCHMMHENFKLYIYLFLPMLAFALPILTSEGYRMHALLAIIACTPFCGYVATLFSFRKCATFFLPNS